LFLGVNNGVKITLIFKYRVIRNEFHANPLLTDLATGCPGITASGCRR
jgi:hypothetical protein